MCTLKPVFTAIIAIGIMLGADAGATVVNDSNTGLASPDKVIDFGSNLYFAFTPITNQFAADGVTFGGSNYLYFTSSGAPTPALTAGALGHPHNVTQPGSIFFSSTVTDAVFSWRAAVGTTFSAWRSGVLQEQATLATSFDDSTGRYYGFTGILFDEIRLSIIPDFPGPDSNLPAFTIFTLDNLQYNRAGRVPPVPLPASLLLFGTALAGLIGVRRVRKHA